MTQPAPTPTTPPPGDPAPAPTEPTTPPPTPPTEPSGDQPLGPTGQKALAAEREARKALEKQLAELSPLKQLAEAISGGQKPADGKSEVDLLNERFASYEKDIAAEREARWRAEVAQEKGLTAQQAARLRGTTRDELVADADELVALFPTGPRTPAPDPSQGARGGQPGPDLQAQIAEARKAGDFRKAISLERSKLQGIQRPS